MSVKTPLIALAAFLACPASADEGMWLFNQFPHAAVLQKYKFDVTSDFLDRLRLASVRIGGESDPSYRPAAWC